VARLVVEGDELVVRLSWAEKFWGFHNDIRVALSAVQRVRVSESPWAELRGWRMAGTSIPGLVAVGTRRHAGGYDFVAVHRQQRAVQVDLNGPPRWQRLVVSVPQEVDAKAEAQAIASSAGIASL
jgi:hypothetical protein